MTRKEAIAVLECLALEMNAILAGIPKSEATADQIKRYIDAYEMAISALRQQECVGDANKALTLDELSERNAPVFYQSKIFRMVGIGVFAKTDTSFLQVDTDLWQKRDKTGCFTARSRRRRMTMMNERRTKMHNDNCNYKVHVEDCAVPAPSESMKDVIADLHDKMMKARAMSDDISEKLFGNNPMACVDNQIEVNCAYDALCDTRRIANYMLETLYAVIQRIEG